MKQKNNNQKIWTLLFSAYCVIETLFEYPSNAWLILGWIPKITVQKMCAEMATTDLEEISEQPRLKKNGFEVNANIW